MRIRLIGQRNSLGIGQHFAHFADALKGINGIGCLVQEIDFTNEVMVSQCINDSQHDDINISFVGANIHDSFKGRHIQWTVFESTKVPDNIMKNLHHANDVWVPSQWGKQKLIENGLDPAVITVVPEGVDPLLFNPYCKNKQTSKLRFLFVGKYEQRKSCQETIHAFAKSLGNMPDVELLVKTNYFVDHGPTFDDIDALVKQTAVNNIGVIWGSMSDLELANLYAQSDVFVLPSKGEGWGLPIIEAAAMALPIITTYYSAPVDYLKDISSSCLFVDFDMMAVSCPEYQRFYPNPQCDWGSWAQPRVDHLADCMLNAKLNIDSLREHAISNSQTVRHKWSWAQTAEKALVAMGF